MNTSQRKIAVVGLGYVGLPVAVAFGQRGPVLGFDINPRRIAELREGHDSTREVDPEELAASQIEFTSDAAALAAADFIIVAVPTPVDDARRPDLTPVLKASETVGRHLTKGAIVVFESTVYPGATEEDCVPVLERSSGLRCGVDFFVGYSPERINPGDRDHTFTRITKVVSGQTPDVLEIVARVYESVVTAGVHRAASIKVAEAAKVIENTQRDLNIALMNELALIFQRLGIDTRDVLAAAGTKWNFLKFDPGLVGGHCIGVDPYYLTHRAQIAGYIPEVILAGRSINDNMGSYIAQQTVKRMSRAGLSIKGGVVTVMGLTFKEDVPDLRNTRVIDIIRELADYGLHVQVIDPLAHPEEAEEEYGIDLLDPKTLRPAQALILAVPHQAFLTLGWAGVQQLLASGPAVVMDVKARLPRAECPNPIDHWRL